MEQLNWYYPEDLSEAARLISDGNKAPHSGGTALIRRGFRGIQSIVDLSRLPMRNIEVRSENIEIGAMSTYNDIIQAFPATEFDHVLVQSLMNSASTPLRNRITAGGSVAAFPAWSDFIGPLLLLNAEVELIGRGAGIYSIQDYLTQRELRAGSLITRIFMENYPHIGLHHRETRTQVDYPAFTITITAGRNQDIFKDLRIVVVGSKDRFHRMERLEDELDGKPFTHLNSINFEDFLVLDIPSRKHGSSEYLQHVARTALMRMLMKIAGEKA
jgi:CO/xanthine dehydrogenase FAD-binding subunit